jgi:hypothetical protein
MLETDGVLRMAANNYQQAESRLEGAEHELRKLLEKLESCLTLMRDASGAEPVTWDRVEQAEKDDRPVVIDSNSMEMVGS